MECISVMSINGENLQLCTVHKSLHFLQQVTQESISGTTSSGLITSYIFAIVSE